ncbi:Neprilysin-4 [Chamberlinius hualienensis]
MTFNCTSRHTMVERVANDVGHTEDGSFTSSKGRPEQLNYTESVDIQSAVKRRNHVVLGFGVGIGLLIATCTVLAVIWALQRTVDFSEDDKYVIRLRPISNDVKENEVCTSEPCVLAASSLMKNMDASVDPCEDFYEYACGNWAKNNPLPDDKSSYDSFNKLRDELQEHIRDLLSASIGTEDCNSTKSAKTLYQSCMNETLIEERGDEPLKNLLKEFGGWPLIEPSWNDSNFDLSLILGNLKLYNNDVLVFQWIGADSQNSTIRTIQLDQPELGLPGRDYYIQEDTKVVDAYYKFMLETALLLGADPETAGEDTTEILKFERELANLTEPPERRRNYTQLYFKVTLGELENITPQINWTRYFQVIIPVPFNSSEEIALYGYPYLVRLGRLLESTPNRVVANYVMWRFVNHRVNNLDRRFSKKKQELYQVLYGRAKEPERWKTCSVYVNTVMGMAVGAMFVKNYFNENSKHDAEDMIGSIQQSFIDIVKTLDWMDSETKAVAIQKAEKISKKIGYPEYILDQEELDKDHEGLTFDPHKYFENVLLNLKHMARWDQERLRIPINKTLWSTAPVVVNAFYSRSKNQILFPAGILQPPFYHSSYPKSMNYGGIGVVIGHEISHGFDDRGRQFDVDGNLKLWWSSVAVQKFHKKAQCIIEQYSNYEVPEISLKVNGIVTQGENIADNGGIRQAFRAYRKWAANHKEEPTLPGLNMTHTQLFFLNFAQVWCTVMTPEAAVSKIRQGPHSPGRFRVIGTLSNSKDFARAFSCPEGSPMNPSHKCSLW